MNIFEDRINRIREKMTENNVNLYIIPTGDPHGSEYIDEHYKLREYISGFTGSAGTLVISKDEAALFVDGRYHIQADIETDGTGITVFKMGLPGVPGIIEYLNNKTCTEDTIALDGRVFMYKDFLKIQEKVTCNINCELDLVSDLYAERPLKNANKVIVLPVSISGCSVADKLADVRMVVEEKCADGLLLSSLDDIAYLFNIRGTDIAYSPVAYGYAYITKDSATLYLQKDTYDELAINELKSQGVYVADYNDVEIELFKLKGKNILVDAEYTSSYYVKIIGLGNNLSYIKNFEVVKKHVKNITEQNHLRKYAVNDAVAVIEFIADLRVKLDNGEVINEYDAGRLLDEYRQKSDDFYGLSFETICAYKENAAIVHYTASEKTSKQIEQKGFLLVDSGSHYMGATTDITRTFMLGDVSDEERNAYTLVLKGNLRLMDAVFPKGVRCENLDILAREALWKNGLDYLHGTGHGIGSFLNVHEGPYRISFRIRDDLWQPEIQPGMVISDEPGYYKNGEYGIRHETQLLCISFNTTEYGDFYGFEPVSLVPFEKDAIDFAILNDDEKESLNRYNKLIIEKVRPYLSKNGKKWLDYNTNYVD